MGKTQDGTLKQCLKEGVPNHVNHPSNASKSLNHTDLENVPPDVVPVAFAR